MNALQRDFTKRLYFERSRSPINPLKITNVLDGDGRDPKRTERRREIERAVRMDRVFSNENNANLNRVERHTNALAKHLRLMDLAAKLNVDMSDCTLPDFVSLISATADDMPSLLHWGMFVPSCKTLLSDEQQKYWLPRCHDCRVVGCYAQTELGHGSNVRALETEARFESDGKGGAEWILNTPTLTSTKFWPGSLGKTANTAMVIARLIDGEGVDRGVHNFIVPIRDYVTHLPLPGITVGDIGSKIGYNTMDNGFLKLENVRVPLDNMAMRFVKVDGDGRYSKRGGGSATQKIAYLTMMQVRAQIVGMAGLNLAMATTIAVRYSAVRVQGYDAKGKKEVQILNYVQQQHRLFGHLASSYCFWIGGRAILKRLKETERELVEGSGKVRKGDMGDLHASLSALKAYCSGAAADGIEDCRKACGGHGYLVASGFPELLTTYLQNPTVEGDNHMLPQQVCKVLLKLLRSAVEGGEGAVEKDWRGCDCYYLVGEVREEEGGVEGGVEGMEGLLRLFKARAGRLLVRLGERLEQLVGEEGMDMAEAWNLCLVEMARLSKAHAVVLLLKHFVQGLELFEAAERRIMEVLCRLWALQIVERDAGDFVGVVGEDVIEGVRDNVVRLLGEVRKSAVVLVDAFDFTDFRLKSALGRFDGNVYPDIMKAAMKDTMNEKEVWEPVVVKGHIGVRGAKL
ncbi:hypothetical protein TrRE_jg6324 [Triparma retinervis]|uniref:Acyl-coenzyme A oxidase n=1 Tax=Triparma retinervis TaxID=2557542 RepID=A0A9W7DSC1_9STRA|nr:hypothetical protein TrRE_jg6324 [Triparma retinervis]